LFIFSYFYNYFLLCFIFRKIFPGRLSSLSNWEGGSMAVRLDFYQAAFEAWKQKPFSVMALKMPEKFLLAAYQPDWGFTLMLAFITIGLIISF
jgi:hypothetical protein